MIERTFDLEAFYARVEATGKERNALRQDLVRGLKDYYEHLYGYDKYGAETIFLLPGRMGQPYIYGFALLRILHDRRISGRVKLASAELALHMVNYGAEFGLPFGFYAALHFLAQEGHLALEDLRYGLVVSAGEQNPFRALTKPTTVGFFTHLLGREEMPAAERAFWGHSLVARHGDQPGAADLINALLGSEELPREQRAELAQAWINFRQPHLAVEVPSEPDDVSGEDCGSIQAAFVANHMPFWVAHSPSWPSYHMARLGLFWLARLGADPLELAYRYIGYSDTLAEQMHYAVADIIAEHHRSMPEDDVRSLIERGITISSSIPTRRKFYRLGVELFGSEYLEKAASDTANSVRQWASKQLAR